MDLPFTEEDAYLAAVVIDVATERGVQVTPRLIIEVVMAGLTEPGTRLHTVASGMEYERARQVTVAALRMTERSEMIAPDLLVPQPGPPPLKAGDRIRLNFEITSGGRPYPKGSTGEIVQPSDPAIVAEFAAAKEHAVLFDQGGLVRIAEVFLDKEVAQES